MKDFDESGEDDLPIVEGIFADVTALKRKKRVSDQTPQTSSDVITPNTSSEKIRLRRALSSNFQYHIFCVLNVFLRL